MLEEYLKEKETKLLSVARKEVLQTPGTHGAKAYYVKKGLLRSYVLDEKGKTHVLMFAPEGWIISDIESHTESKPTKLYIDALEESEIIQVNQFTLEDFMSSESDNKFLIQKLFKRVTVLQKRVMLLMSATAQERYEYFVDTYPQLLHRVPLKMIASYLGMTPEALSNIRAKIRG